MLLARLERQPVGGMAVGVHRHADQAAGQLPAQVIADRQVRGVRAAVEQRHAEPLGGAERDVGAEFARRLQQGERQDVGGHRHLGAGRVRGLDDRGQVAHLTARARVLQQHAEDAAEVGGRGDRRDPQLDAERLGPGPQHVKGLRQAVGVGEEDSI